MNISTAALPIEFHGEWNMKPYEGFHKKLNKWIHSSKQEVKGLPDMSYIVSGITDAFNQTYSLYNKIGVFEGEYGYHNKVFPDRVTNNLLEADIIIISHPFSGDGESSHNKIAEADKLGKPIFIDCAFFGICDNISFDFTMYQNIHSVCFSLSKTFGTGRQRVGILYTKDKYPLRVYSDWGYPLFSSAMFHYDLIDKMTPDCMYRKYRKQQLEICKELYLIPSSTVIFGLDYSDRYKDFKRGQTNRVCISGKFKCE